MRTEDGNSSQFGFCEAMGGPFPRRKWLKSPGSNLWGIRNDGTVKAIGPVGVLNITAPNLILGKRDPIGRKKNLQPLGTVPILPLLPLYDRNKEPLHVLMGKWDLRGLQVLPPKTFPNCENIPLLTLGKSSFQGLVACESLSDEIRDYAMSTETVIVGDESGRFLHRSRDNSRNFSRKGSVDAVAMVFARDRQKPQGVGEIQFHIASSTGLSTVGSIYKAVSVRAQGKKSEISTWLTAKRDGIQEVLDGTTILNAINDEMENGIGCSDLYIGVTKRRKCSVGSEKVKMMTTLAFHEVQGGDESFLFVDGFGLKTGDTFRFYYSDPTTASTTCVAVFENLKRLKEDLNSRVSHCSRGVADEDHKKTVLGGMIFNCYGRGESFFGARNVDSSPFLDNFPGVPSTGTFSCGEIRRAPLSSYRQEDDQEDPAHCCLHVYTCVYLVMSYTPTLP
ncbi:hypothetical protein RJ641_014186 [Dillenia turbinata]|uniref:FIST C-domain domain-containing protein n=1 Tax=Dillenia turbinata TaxID=194707 RepID=A0AAN8Z4M7_9MAGN